MADNGFSSIFSVEFESLESVKVKLNKLTSAINKSADIKLNFDSSEITNVMNDITKLSRQQISILPNGQITTLQKFNTELGKTVTLRENLSKGTTGISIDDNFEKKQQAQAKETEKMYKEYTKLFDQAIAKEQKLIEDMANAREKSEIKRQEAIKKTEQAQVSASNKALEQSKLEEQKIKEYIKLEQEKLKIKQKSIELNRGDLVNNYQSSNIGDSISGLSAKTMDEARKKVSYLNLELQKLDQSARMKGIQVGQKNIMSFGESIKSTAVKLGIFASTAMVINEAQRTIKNATAYTIELNMAMIDLKKVTDETSDTYNKFLSNMHYTAIQLGTQSDQMVKATSNWAKTGKSLREAAKLAENTIIMTKVGDVDSVDKAQQYMIAPLKAFNIEAEKSIELIDKYNNISNNMATTTIDVGEGLNIAANSLGVAGNSLEQSIALIATAESTTKNGGSVIGNALKTISLRIATFKNEDGELIPALADDFKKLGVSAVDSAGQIRSTFDIMRDLGNIYKDLDTNMQLKLSEMLGGKRQANIIASILSNVDELDRAYSLATNSAGSALEEFEKYQQGIEYALDQLKEQVNGLYTSFLNGGLFKELVNGSADAISAIRTINDTFGTIPTVLTTVVGAMTLFNAKFRESTQVLLGLNPNLSKIFVNLNNYSKGFSSQANEYTKQISFLKDLAKISQEAGVSTSGFGKELLSLSGKLTLTTAKLITTKVAAFALQTALSMGLTLVVTTLISKFSEFVDSLIITSKELKQLNQDAILTMNGNKDLIKSVETLIKREDELKEKLSKKGNTYNEQKQYRSELLEVQKEIANILPESSNAFDNEGNAISTNTDKVLENLEAKKKLSESEAIKSIKNNSNYETTTKAPEEYDKWKKQLEEMREAYRTNQQYMDREVTSNWLQKVEKKVKEYEEAIEIMSTSINSLRTAGWDENRIAQEIFKNMPLESAIESYKTLIDVVDKYNQELQNVADTTSSDNIERNLDSSNKSVSELEKLYASLGYTVSEVSKKLEELNSMSFDDANAQALKDTTAKYSEITSEIGSLKETLKEINSVQAMTPDLISKIVKTYPEIGYKVNDVASAQEFLQQKIIETAETQANAYNQMLSLDSDYYNDKIKTNQALQDDFAKVINSFVTSNEKGYIADWKNYSSINALKEDLAKHFGTATAELISNMVLANSQGYDVDVDNTIVWATEKAQILQQLSNQIEKVKNQLTDHLRGIKDATINSDGLLDEKLATKAQETLDKLGSKQEKILTEFYKKNEGYKKYIADIGTSGIDISPSSKKDSGSSKKDSKASEKEVENIKLKKDAYYELNAALQKVNNELAKNESLKDTIGEDKYLENKIKLLNEQLVLTEKIKKKELEESKTLKKNITGWFNFDSNGLIKDYDKSMAKLESWANSGDKENRKKQAESLVADAERYMAIINKDIPDLDKTIIDTSKAITEALTRQTEVKIEKITNNIEKLTNEIDKKLSAIEYKQSHFADYSYSDNIKFDSQKLDLAKTKLAQLTAEYTKLTKTTAKTVEGKELLAKAISEVEEKIQSEKLNALELTKSLEKLKLEQLNSSYNSKMWQKGTQQSNAIDLKLQAVDDDDVAAKIKLMNEQLKLNQSIVKDTEKYIQGLRNTNVTTAEGYGELISKLKSAEEGLYSQQSAVNSLKDSMKQLAEETMTKYINQLKEIEKLQLDAKQESELKALDSEYFRVSEKDFNKYKANRVSSIKEEISLLKDKLSVDRNNAALLDMLKAKQKELLNLESSRYSAIEDWYSVQQDMHNFNISKIDEELAALQEKEEIEKETADRLAKQNELIELQTKLTNIKNNKNIRQLQKNDDGSWNWGWDYDKKEYADTQKTYKDKQEELAKWEEELEKDKYKKKLELQKKYEQDSLNALKETYDKQKAELDKLHEAQDKALEDKYDGMLENLDKYLEQLSEKFGGDVPKIIETLQVELDKGKEFIKSFNESLSDLFSESVLQEGQSDDVAKIFDLKYSEILEGSKKFFGNQLLIREDANKKELNSLAGQNKKVQDSTKSHIVSLNDIYKTGWSSIIDNIKTSLSDGLSNITSFNNQIVNQTRNTLSEIANLKSALAELNDVKSQVATARAMSVDLPNVANINIPNAVSENTTSITVQKVEFPNAKNSVEIEKAFDSLATRATQYKSK